ncbi:MAG: hypothetical protein J6B54_00340 [Clostridia bacterium]|nr:hypothetical protein [Clostridia bacterium]
MKKLLSLALILVLTFSFASCVDVSETGTDKNPSTGGNTTPSDKTEVTLSEKVIFNQNDVEITVTGMDYSGFFGPSVKVLIENNSQKNLTVQTRDSSVNGAMIETIFSEDIAAGKKANSSIVFAENELKTAGIQTIKNIEFKIYLFDTESYDDVATSETITLTTSADVSFDQIFDKSGETLYDEDGIKVIAKKLSSRDSFWGSELYLYIENNTEENITIQTKDVSINGFMVDPVFSCEILSGKVAFSSVTFLESDLTDNGIEDITELELKLNIFNKETWDDIKDTDIIKISFNG